MSGNFLKREKENGLPKDTELTADEDSHHLWGYFYFKRKKPSPTTLTNEILMIKIQGCL